jgi:hypothetical protein
MQTLISQSLGRFAVEEVDDDEIRRRYL